MDESLRNPVLSPIQETEESVSSVTTGVSLIPKEGEENKATEMDASKATIDSSTETAGPIEPDTASVPAASCKVESTTGIGPEVSDPVESVTSVASAIIATLDQTAAIIAATSAHAESVAANVSPISVTEESAAATDKSTSNSTSLKSPDSSSDSPSEPAGGPVEPRIKIVTGAVESPIELATVEPVVTIITPSVVHYQAKSSPIETVRPVTKPALPIPSTSDLPIQAAPLERTDIEPAPKPAIRFGAPSPPASTKRQLGLGPLTIPSSIIFIPAEAMANWTPKSVKKAMYIGGLACILFVVGLIGSSFFEYKECSKKNNYGLPDPDEVLPARWGAVRLFQNEAICVDGTVCAEIGRSMFYRNGSVVDAAIATMICNGIVNMQSMGVGGGFLMTIYKRDTREAYVLNARDRAPHDLNSSIFENNDPRDSFQGPLAIAVPGEVAGYWAAHKKFGKIKWRELFEPSIKLCEDGYKMTKYQRDSVILTGKAIYNDPILKERFINPKTNEIKAVGSLIKSKLLCETLRNISIKGASDFYQGEIGKNLINDLKKKGALMTLEDLENYDAKWQKPVETTFSNGVTLKTVGLPGSGGPLALILNILDGYNFTSKDIEDFTSTTKTYHKVVEAFKYAFALRSNLGDPDFTDMEDIMKNFTSKNFADAIRNKISLDKTWEDPNHYGATSSFTDDHGTSHIAILGPNGDGVSVTSSINFYFGSGIVSESTGIILNNVIDDFGVLKKSNFHGIPANKNNFVQPFKQPISSMSPSILTEPNGDIKLLVGAAGGTKIITSITQIIARMLWMDQTIKEAVEAPRIHHQLIPKELAYEYGIPKRVIEGLQALGHKTLRYKTPGSVVCSIHQTKGAIYVNPDYRTGANEHEVY